MNIYHQTLPVLDGCFDVSDTIPSRSEFSSLLNLVIPSSEFSDLLDLVVPSSDMLLHPIEMVVPSHNYDLRSDIIPNSSEFSELLNLLIPSSDELLPPIEMAIPTNNYNPIGYSLLGFMPHLSTLPYQNGFDLCGAESQKVKVETVKAEPFPMNVSKLSLTKKHNTMPSLLAIDAPPKAPYDDGFSTASENVNNQGKHPYQSPDSPLSTHACSSVRCAIVTENQLNIHPRTKKPIGKCEVAGCNTKKQTNGRCIRHGGGRRCEVEGCTRGAQTRGRCKRHGGGARCKVEGCNTSSQGGGLCRVHGGGKLCSTPGCRKGTQRQGKCATHASRKCSADDCSNTARCSGFCIRHKKQRLQL